jgi:hypothetical protein
MILQLLFLLFALLWVLSCILPNWSGPPVLTLGSLVRCVIGLVVLVILYLIVAALLVAVGIALP